MFGIFTSLGSSSWKILYNLWDHHGQYLPHQLSSRIGSYFVVKELCKLTWISFSVKDSPMNLIIKPNSLLSIYPLPSFLCYLLFGLIYIFTPSNTLNASLSSSSAFSSLLFIRIMVRNSGKSILPVPSLSTSFTISWSSASVGFCPMNLSTFLSWCVSILPSPLLSNLLKAS